MIFQSIFGFSAEKLGVLAENYTHGCLFYILWVRRNHFRATFLKQVFKHFKFSGLLEKFPWQHRTNLFRVDKIAKSVSRNKLRKKLFQEKKNTILIFSRFWAKFFYAISEKFPSWLSKLQSTYIFKVLRKNFFFSNWTWFQPSSDWDENK